MLTAIVISTCSRSRINAPLLLGAPPIDLAIRFLEVALQSAALVFGHTVTALLAAFAPTIASAVAALGAGPRPTLLRLGLRVGALKLPGTGCSRARNEPGCYDEREQNTLHASTCPSQKRLSA
jgi:hypothetical protein